MLILIALLFVLPTVGEMLGISLNVFSWVMGPPINFVLDAIIVLTGHS
jgi:hypothetical protein